jgi:hypothetical protein
MTHRTHVLCMCDFKMGKRITRYLAGTSDYRLDGADIRFEVYTEADWVNESSDRKSVNAA